MDSCPNSPARPPLSSPPPSTPFEPPLPTVDLDIFQLSSIVASNAPVLRMHPRDRFMPCDVDTFLEGSRLLEKAEAWDDVHYSGERPVVAEQSVQAAKGIARNGVVSWRWRSATQTLLTRGAGTGAAPAAVASSASASQTTRPVRPASDGFPAPPPEGWRVLRGRGPEGDGWEGVMAAQEARLWRRARHHDDLKVDRNAARAARNANGAGEGFVAVRGSAAKADAPAQASKEASEPMWVMLRKQPTAGGAGGGGAGRKGTNGRPEAADRKGAFAMGDAANSTSAASPTVSRAHPAQTSPATDAIGGSNVAASAGGAEEGSDSGPVEGSAKGNVDAYGRKTSTSPSGQLRPVHTAIYHGAPAMPSPSSLSSSSSSGSMNSARSLARSLSSQLSPLTLSRAASVEGANAEGGRDAPAGLQAAKPRGAAPADGAATAPAGGLPSDPYDPLYAEERDLELAAELAARLEAANSTPSCQNQGTDAAAAAAGAAETAGTAGASAVSSGPLPSATLLPRAAASARPAVQRPSTRDPPYPLSMLPMHFDPSFDPGQGLRLDLHPSARPGVPREDVDDVPLYAHVKVVGGAPESLALGVASPSSGMHPSLSVSLTLEINYLTLYAYNGPYRLGGLGAVQVGAHDGDWEHWTARVAWPSGELLGAWHSAHRARDGCWEVGERVLRAASSRRPVAYVALHGHGTYPRPGRVLRHFFLGNDLCADGGVEWRPKRVVLLPVGQGSRHGFGRWFGTDRWGANAANEKDAAAPASAARAGAGEPLPSWPAIVVPDRGTPIRGTTKQSGCAPAEPSDRAASCAADSSPAPPTDVPPAEALVSPLAGRASLQESRSHAPDWTVVTKDAGSFSPGPVTAKPQGLPLIVHGDPCRWLFFRGLWGETDAPICQGWFLSSECPVSRTPLLRLFGHHVREVGRV